jgi:flagellar hook-length control protein FliK
MNVAPIELFSPESLPVSAKKDGGATDLFSALMVSMAAGNIPQPDSSNILTDGMAELTEVVASHPGNGSDQPPNKGATGDIPGRDTGVENPAVKLIQAREGPSYAGSEDAATGDVATPSITQGKEFAAEAAGPVASFNIMEASNRNEMLEEASEPLAAVIRQMVAGEDKGAAHWENKAFIQGKAGEVDKEARVAGYGKDAIAAAKNSETGTEIAPSFGQRHVEAVPGEGNMGTVSVFAPVGGTSTPFLAADDGGSRAVKKTAIDPAALIEQVSGRIRTGIKGNGGEVRMRLHPESLGELRIEVRVDGGAVKANILTESAMVKDAVESSMPLLRQSLESHGLRVDQLSVGIDQRHGGGNPAERDSFHGRQEPGGRKAPHHEDGRASEERWSGYAAQHEDGLSIFA